MLVTILAVTNTYDGYCIAGMTEEGNWIRPLPPQKVGRRFWSRDFLNFPEKGAPVVVGDVWEISGSPSNAYQFPNHVEDFRIESHRYVRTMTDSELMKFIEQHAEDEKAFRDTVNSKRRSLCLIEISEAVGFTETWEGKVKVRMHLRGNSNLNNPKTSNGAYPVTCCKWSRLIRDGHGEIVFRKAFVSIGLSTPTPYDGKEYPQIIGLHTEPTVPIPATYPL